MQQKDEPAQPRGLTFISKISNEKQTAQTQVPSLNLVSVSQQALVLEGSGFIYIVKLPDLGVLC